MQIRIVGIAFITSSSYNHACSQYILNWNEFPNHVTSRDFNDITVIHFLNSDPSEQSTGVWGRKYVITVMVLAKMPRRLGH